MKKIDLNFQLTDLAGAKLDHAGEITANILGHCTDNSIKFYDWAIKLYKKEVIEVDDSDFTLIYDLVKSTDKMTNIGKGPILKYLDTLK